MAAANGSPRPEGGPTRVSQVERVVLFLAACMALAVGCQTLFGWANEVDERAATVAAVASTLTPPPTAAPSPTATEVPTAEVRLPTVQVYAGDQYGVSTGLIVSTGDRVMFRVLDDEPSWCWGPRSRDPDPDCPGPDGTRGRPDEGDGCRGRWSEGNFGLLLGQVGDDGQIFPIGDALEPITMSDSGELTLLMNDCAGQYSDNEGSLVVEVSLAGPDG